MHALYQAHKILDKTTMVLILDNPLRLAHQSCIELLLNCSDSVRSTICQTIIDFVEESPQLSEVTAKLIEVA